MEHLWSPWRMAYIEGAPTRNDRCIFCDAASGEDGDRAFVLARSERSLVMLNAYPYNPGHLLVAPLRHVGDFEELGPEELQDLQALVQRAIGALRRASSPDGYNVGLNLGRVAGAGIPGHLHWHVIPRWNGDTNFVTVSAETRVLPELLADTFERLRPYL